MNELECLSLMELLDVRAEAEDSEGRVHLQSCPRCRALLAELPADLQLPDLPQATISLSVRPAIARPDLASTGQLWRAVPHGDTDWTWVVAVIGRSPDAEDRVLVAPVVAQPEMATERDLLLEGDVLGYAGFVDLANLGTVLRCQLLECIGVLERSQAAALVSLYRSALGVGPAPPGLPTGPRVLTQNDPRLLAAQERNDRVRALWRAVDDQVTDTTVEQQPQEEPPVAPTTLANVLKIRLCGAGAAWDRNTLLQVSHVDGQWLDKFLRDQLDLTDKRDIGALAGVLHALEVPWNEAEPAVVLTLAGSGGGRREASGPTIPMAARSRPGATEQEITEQLYADQSQVVQSDAARRGELVRYVAELRGALDELE